MVNRLRCDPAWRVEALVTTVNEANGRVAMHGTSDGLLRRQAKSLGLELVVIGLPENCDNCEYEKRLAEGLQPFLARDIDTVACGDLLLEDIRHWREQSFRGMGWEVVFPIWGTPTDELAQTLTRAPWDIVLTCIDTQRLPEGLLGARLDADLIKRLPKHVDPCGENGEFHTFVCNGPGFTAPIEVIPGHRVLSHGRFLMLDLGLA